MNIGLRPIEPLRDAETGQTGQLDVPSSSAIQIFAPLVTCAVQIVNLSNIDIYIGFTPQVSTNSGHLLIGIKGSSISIDTFTFPIWAIATSAGARLSWLEYQK